MLCSIFVVDYALWNGLLQRSAKPVFLGNGFQNQIYLMIAVSSHRPHQSDVDYAKNQILASKSWDVFTQIYYFGPFEKDLYRPNVTFIDSEPWPKIKHIVDIASNFAVPVAIINADIVVTPVILDVEKKMIDLSIPALTSYRYEFEGENLDGAIRHKSDRGMDIFIAGRDIWRMVYKRIPDYLRIGHQTWDSWMCGFFCANLGFGFRQFTDYRCIFHPKHEGRLHPHSSEIKSDDEYFTRAHVPSPL